MSIYDFLANAMDLSGKRKPFIIGIAGPAGVGKSSMADELLRYLQLYGKKVLVIRIDDFFKSPEARQKLGEWGPNHVRLDEVRRILGLIKQGHKFIQSEKYIRKPKKQMIPWEIEMDGIDIVIFEGLYAISNSEGTGNLIEFVDLSVYLTASLQDVKRWRFQQEEEKPDGRNLEDMERHWKAGILPDTINNVKSTEKNADIIIEVDHDHQLHVKQ
jgi:uridine kinase